MPTATIHGTTLHYDRTGSGDPALVFVHGMCGGGWVWADQVARLADRFTCVTYDRRGHSRSHAGSDGQSAEVHAADLAGLIRALGLDRPVVVGSSGGGVVVVELLHRQAELVSAAVVSEPPLFSIDHAAGEALVAEVTRPLQRALERGGPAAALEAFFGVVCPGLWECIDEDRQEAYRANAELLFATLDEPGSTVTVEDLARIVVPTVVVAGAGSPAAHRELACRLADGLGRARHVVFERSGHATYLDRPQAFADTVATLAEQVHATRGS